MKETQKLGQITIFFHNM